jgi:hypothetical protein
MSIGDQLAERMLNLDFDKHLIETVDPKTGQLTYTVEPNSELESFVESLSRVVKESVQSPEDQSGRPYAHAIQQLSDAGEGDRIGTLIGILKQRGVQMQDITRTISPDAGIRERRKAISALTQEKRAALQRMQTLEKETSQKLRGGLEVTKDESVPIKDSPSERALTFAEPEVEDTPAMATKRRELAQLQRQEADLLPLLDSGDLANATAAKDFVISTRRNFTTKGADLLPTNVNKGMQPDVRNSLRRTASIVAAPVDNIRALSQMTGYDFEPTANEKLLERYAGRNVSENPAVVEALKLIKANVVRNPDYDPSNPESPQYFMKGTKEPLPYDFVAQVQALFHNSYTPEQRAELGIGKQGDVTGGLIKIGRGEAADNRDTLLDSGRSTLARAQEAYVNAAFGDARSLPADVKDFLKTRATGDQRHRIRELSEQGGLFNMHSRPAQMYLGNYQQYIEPRNGLLYSGRLSPEALEPMLRERLNLPDQSLARPATEALRRSYEVYDIMGAQPSSKLEYFINPDGTPVYYPTKRRYQDEINQYFDVQGRAPNTPKLRQTGLEDDLSRARFSPALAGLIG